MTKRELLDAIRHEDENAEIVIRGNNNLYDDFLVYSSRLLNKTPSGPCIIFDISDNKPVD